MQYYGGRENHIQEHLLSHLRRFFRGEGCKTYTEEAWIDDWVMLAERYRDKGLLGEGLNPKP